MYEVQVKEASTRLPDLITAAVRGETVFIITAQNEVVRLVPIKRAKKRRQFGSAKGLIKMADDFDAPLDDFKEYRE